MMKTHDPKRRTILLGTLAAGASLALQGCKGKQEEAAQTDSGTAASIPPDQPTQPQRTEEATTSKMSQEGAQYQTTPMEGRKCANCINFIAESNTCKVVEGQISPEGWCILWTAA